MKKQPKPKPYMFHTLEVCEDPSNPAKVFEYTVTVGHKAPKHYSPDDDASGYHYAPAEWEDMLRALARGELPPVGNDATCADAFIIRVLE